MDDSQAAYERTAQAYAEGARKLFTTGTPQRVERGLTPALRLDPAAVASQAGQLETLSRSLTLVTASGLEEVDPQARAEAATRLLAKAMVDLQVSAFLLDAAEQEEGNVPGSLVMRGGLERSYTPGVPPSVEEALSILQGIPTPADSRVERKITVLPADLPRARAQLKEMLANTLEQIELRAGRTAQSALSGLLGMGAGKVLQAAGIVGMDIARAFGAAEKVSQLYALFRQFFLNAYNALVALLGENLSRAAANQVAAWVNDVAQGEKFASLLEKLYETGKTRAELAPLVEASPAALEQYIAALNGLDALNTQYLKQAGVIEKIITVLRFVPGVPAAALPQGQLLLGATYLMLCGYTVFAGADYVDAPRVPRIDRVPGPRRILTGSLAAHEPVQAPSEPETAEPPKGNRPPPGPPRPQQPRQPQQPPVSRGIEESSSKDLPGGISFGIGVEPKGPLEATSEEVNANLIEEKIRMDVAAPDEPVTVGETFEIAVAIRRPSSDKIAVDGLGSVTSGEGSIYRHASDELVRYRVVVTAPDCNIVAAEYTFMLRAGTDSPPRFFQLTPKRPGRLSIIVNAFQEGDLVAQTRMRVVASVQAAEPVSTEARREKLRSTLEQKPKRPPDPARIKEFIDLDIELFDYEIDDQQVERFKARVTCDLCGEQKIADADLVEIPPKMRGQLNLLKLRQLSAEDITELGKAIGQLLFPPTARRFFQRARARLDEDENGLRIRLKADEYPLAAIPWEYAYLAPDDAPADHSDPEGFLVLDHHLSLVRYEVMGQPVADLDPVGESALRMVVLLSNSTDAQFPRLNLAQEKKNITQALKNMPGIELDCFSSATIQTVQDALENPASIFHFAGHGTYQGELGPLRGTLDGEGYLVLKGRTLRESLFSARKLALNLRGRGVRLAVLGVCQGGERDPVNAWTGIAPALARAGIPAVVAMQFSVYDESAIAFHRAFYRALALGYPVDTAVSNGRLAVFNLPTSDRDWGVPVLYLRCDDGVLFPR